MAEPAEPRVRDERLLADAVREYASDRVGLRVRDLDRIEIAAMLDAQGVCYRDIADVIGVRPWEVRRVLAGGVVR